MVVAQGGVSFVEFSALPVCAKLVSSNGRLQRRLEFHLFMFVWWQRATTEPVIPSYRTPDERLGLSAVLTLFD